MQFITVAYVAVALFIGMKLVSASVLPAVDKREFCVDVTGDWCTPGVVECCEQAGTCTVDQDGHAVRDFFRRSVICTSLTFLGLCLDLRPV